MDQRSLRLAAESVEPAPFVIPGATGGTFRIQILNEDSGRGIVTSIVHIPAGGRIPAHCHRAGAEMHFLLDGDLTDGGQALPPGGFTTQAAGVVHGPHESRGGARVLTVQSWQSSDGDFDFEPAAEATEATPTGEMQDGKLPEGGLRKVDEGAQQAAREEAAAPEGKGYS
ncbi:cupin domain-containing protein [Falsiroseomonas ponticola]|uniref:cupin domain-containing protein n=1 Tax=Falsiroseomonas ponticola TaxID=2786951 RepID=UPI001933DFD3|nr:cupin domain-containing protein [Roseomonas ponticola]